MVTQNETRVDERIVVTDWEPEPGNTATYMFDPMHFPFPLSPLFQSIFGLVYGHSVTLAVREYNLPIERMEAKFHNNYLFSAWIEKKAANEEEAQALGEAAEATLKPAIGRMMTRWEEESLPRVLEIQEQLRRIAFTDGLELANGELIDDIYKLIEELWVIHFQTVFPMLVGIQLFDEFYADLFGPDSDSQALVVGTRSASVRAGIGLSNLAKSARRFSLDSMFTDGPPDLLISELEQSEAGRAFLKEMHAYLDEFGLRQDLFDFLTPTWLEAPSIVIGNVRGYLLSGVDSEAEYERKVEQADSAVATARETLSTYPEAVQEQFEAMLQFARNGAYIHEEHNYRIDQQAMGLARLAFLRTGQRLVDSGRMNRAEDVFMLHLDELRSAMNGELGDLRSLVEERVRNLEATRQLTPPPFIGPPPEGPPPDTNPMMRAVNRFWGGPPQESASPNELKGNAGSRGIATGEAFVVRTLEEATSLRPGQILVTITTMPPWTPLFAIAGAIVTETGGPLSHCAIVAREYGIPAVVGAHGATRRIETGQTITVDGTNGIVTLGS